MARVIDIDDLIDLDKIIVKIAGVDYRLPGDIPVPDYLTLRRLFNQLIEPDQDDDETEPDQVIEELHDRLLAMFKVHQPNMEELPFGPKTIVPVVFAYLNNGMGEQVEDAPPPTRPASTKKKTSGSPQSTTRTPSR